VTVTGSYTLLADDNCAFSKAPALYENFKSHIVFNILTQGSLTFSDNQLMSSLNLRKLLRPSGDGVIKELVRQEQILLAVRAPTPGQPMPLGEVFEVFHREGKLPPGHGADDPHNEIDFMEENCLKIPWSYGDVRSFFTQTCTSLIIAQANAHFGPLYGATIQEWLAEETERDNGLGRKFLQIDLPDKFLRAGICDRDRAASFLRICTDAAYLSNLPQAIGLDPIYATEHSDSFQLLRGGEMAFEPFEDPLDLRPRLSARHFAHGLNQLDVDDIAHIQATDAFREYRALLLSSDPVAAFDPLFVAYGELNRMIEDRIIERFRSLLRASSAPEPRSLQRSRGTWLQHGLATALDLLSVAQIVPGLVGMGIASNLVIDAIRAKVTPDRPHVDAARHDLERHKLAEYLRAHGKAEEIGFEQSLSTTTSFDRELVVR